MSLVLHRTTLVDLEATSTLASGVWLEPFAAWLWWSNWCSACQFLDVFWPPESWSHFPSVIGVDSFFCEELQWNCGGMKKVDSNTLKHRSRAQRSWGMEERAMKLRCLDLDSPHLQPEVAAKAWMAWAELLNWDIFFFSGERQKGLRTFPSSHELGCVRFNSLDSQIPWLPTQNTQAPRGNSKGPQDAIYRSKLNTCSVVPTWDFKVLLCPPLLYVLWENHGKSMKIQNLWGIPKTDCIKHIRTLLKVKIQVLGPRVLELQSWTMTQPSRPWLKASALCWAWALVQPKANWQCARSSSRCCETGPMTLEYLGSVQILNLPSRLSWVIVDKIINQ